MIRKHCIKRRTTHQLLTIYGNMKDFSEKLSIMSIAEET